MESLRSTDSVSSKLPPDMVRYLKDVKNISPTYKLTDGKTVEYHAYHLLKSNDVWDRVKLILENIPIRVGTPPSLDREEISER